MHESFFRGLNTSSRLIAEHYCVHGNPSTAQLRVALSLSSLLFSSFLFSSVLYEKRSSPTFYGFFVATRLCTSQSSRHHLFFLPFSYVFIHTSLGEIHACFLLKRLRRSLTDARLAVTNFFPSSRDNAFVYEMHSGYDKNSVDWWFERQTIDNHIISVG